MEAFGNLLPYSISLATYVWINLNQTVKLLTIKYRIIKRQSFQNCSYNYYFQYCIVSVQNH